MAGAAFGVSASADAAMEAPGLLHIEPDVVVAFEAEPVLRALIEALVAFRALFDLAGVRFDQGARRDEALEVDRVARRGWDQRYGDQDLEDGEGIAPLLSSSVDHRHR